MRPCDWSRLEVEGLTLEEVRGMKSSDPRKEILAWPLKRRTPMRDTWIAERLQLGQSSQVCMLVRRVQTALEGARAKLKWEIYSAFEARPRRLRFLLVSSKGK